MSDAKKPETLELIASRDGFYQGARVKAGTRFTWTGTVRPKWAAPPGEKAALAPVPTMRNGDLKPAKARMAARTKTGSSSEAA